MLILLKNVGEKDLCKEDDVEYIVYGLEFVICMMKESLKKVLFVICQLREIRMYFSVMYGKLCVQRLIEKFELLQQVLKSGY